MAKNSGTANWPRMGENRYGGVCNTTTLNARRVRSSPIPRKPVFSPAYSITRKRHGSIVRDALQRLARQPVVRRTRRRESARVAAKPPCTHAGLRDTMRSRHICLVRLPPTIWCALSTPDHNILSTSRQVVLVFRPAYAVDGGRMRGLAKIFGRDHLLLTPFAADPIFCCPRSP